MRTCFLGLVLAGNLLVAASASAEVTVTMVNGNVSVSATNATLGQILAEWARVGQTRIVNVERVSGAPITIELVNVPEAQALDTVLRSVSGYLAAPRTAPAANASTFDRIFLLPTSTGTPARAAASAAMAAPFAAPPQTPSSFQPGPFIPEDDSQQDLEAVRQAPIGRGGPIPPPPIRGGGGEIPFRQPANGRQPGIQPAIQPGGDVDIPFPSPFGVTAPANPFATGGVPTTPMGVSRPGMPVPTPQQQPDKPVRQP